MIVWLVGISSLGIPVIWRVVDKLNIRLARWLEKQYIREQG